MKRVFDYIYLWAERMPNHTALVFEDERISYQQLRDRSISLACFLIDCGVCECDHVAYILCGCPQFFYLYLACSMIGVSVAGINIKSPAIETIGILNEINPVLTICDDSVKYIDMISEWNPLLISQLEFGPGRVRFNSIDEKINRVSENDIVFQIFTSGTTGMPKGALLTHKNILTSVGAQIREFGYPTGLKETDVIQHHVPLNHVSGAVQWGVAPLVAGSTIIINREFNPSSIMMNMVKYGATILTGVPAMWKMFFALPDFSRYDLSFVRWCAIGAAPADESLINRILEICEYCSNPLGLTETSGFCSFFGELANSSDLVNTVGRIIPELSYKIVDNEFHSQNTGTIGQLAYRGRSVIDRYTNGPLPLTDDGYYLSGDLAFEDSKGLIHLCGRADDMFLVGGYNVYPLEIEKVIMKYPHIEKVAVIPVPHKKMGNVCKAFIVPSGAHVIDKNKLKSFLSDNLMYYKIPRDIEICSSLPTTSLGKVNRQVLINSVSQDC